MKNTWNYVNPEPLCNNWMCSLHDIATMFFLIVKILKNFSYQSVCVHVCTNKQTVRISIEFTHNYWNKEELIEGQHIVASLNFRGEFAKL